MKIELQKQFRLQQMPSIYNHPKGTQLNARLHNSLGKIYDQLFYQLLGRLHVDMDSKLW